MTRALFVLVLLAAPAWAQETADTAFARIEAAVEAFKTGTTPEVRVQAQHDMLAACDAFLAGHRQDGTPQQVETAAGYWLELALRMELEADVVLARVADFRATIQPLPPRLARACTIVEATLRLRPGQPAPSWSAPTVHGTDAERLSLADLKGKVVLLDFWATWCAPCIQLAGTRLRRLHARYGSQDGFVLVSVGSPRRRETPEKQAALAEDQGWAWTKVFDEAGTINESYGVRALPTLVLIDAEGKLVTLGAGHDVIAEVEAYLAERFGPLVPPPEAPHDEALDGGIPQPTDDE